MILFIKHIEVEGPGTIEEYFRETHGRLKTVDLSQGEALPEDLSAIAAVVSLGGPMNVYEEDRYPFLKAEDVFLKRLMREEIPLLGICLGSQLIAKAGGARVRKSPVKEVGWFKVQLAKEAQSDSFFSGLPEEIEVFQWHEDTFDIPANGVLLAQGVHCPHQAFRVGRCAWGIQFHIEVTERIIADWCRAYFKSDDLALRQKAQDMLEAYRQKKALFDKNSEILYRNFAKLILQRLAKT